MSALDKSALLCLLAGGLMTYTGDLAVGFVLALAGYVLTELAGKIGGYIK